MYVLPELLDDALEFGNMYFYIPALKRHRGTSHLFIGNLNSQDMSKKNGKEIVGSASETTGQSIIAATPGGNNFYEQVESDMGNFFDRITKVGAAGLNMSSEINEIVGKIGATSNQFVGQIGNGLAD